MSYGTTKTADPNNSRRITTDKSQKTAVVNPTTARWNSSNRPMNSTVSKAKNNSPFTCPNKYMQSSTASQRPKVQQSANKTYTNSYGMARVSGGNGNRFNCYG